MKIKVMEMFEVEGTCEECEKIVLALQKELLKLSMEQMEKTKKTKNQNIDDIKNLFKA